MKKLALLLALLSMFAFGAFAQDTGQSSSTSSQTTTTSKKTMHHKGMMSGKMSTLTGCVSKDPNADGMFTLSNGRYKKGVEIGPTDKVKEHAGHQVKLTGHWASAAAAGESDAAATSGKEKGEHHFEVDSLTHLSATCKEAPGGGTTGTAAHHAKKSKKSGTGETSSPQ